MTIAVGCADSSPSRHAGPLLRALEGEIERAFRDLPDAELRLLRIRFGIGARRRSLGDAARHLGLSVSAARRLQRRALRTLRTLALPPDVPRYGSIIRRPDDCSAQRIGR